jgi:hypothetical protein
MNHDMIAAGHPRLNFDYWAYQRLLRPHWFEPPAPPGTAARAWLVGRIAAAEALLRLHTDRAARGGPVPDLSEFNCYACHHALAPGDWRGRAGGYYAGRMPGSLAWQLPWPLARPGVLTPAEAEPVLAGFVARASGRPAADPAARALAAARERVAGGGPIPPDRFLALIACDDSELGRIDWDQACGLYYALRAAEADLFAADPLNAKRPEVTTVFGELAGVLTLPAPRTAARRTDSPTGYDPARLAGRFQKLQQELTRAAATRPR